MRRSLGIVATQLPAVFSDHNCVSPTDSKRGRLPCGAPAGFVLVNVFIYTLAPPLRHST